MKNYFEQVKADVEKWIEDNSAYLNLGEYKTEAELESYLYNRLWYEDTVTGKASGSYTGNSLEAKENVFNDKDAVIDMIADNEDYYFDASTITKRLLNEEWEWFDVETRCYTLSSVIYKVAKEIFEKKKEEKRMTWRENKEEICAELLTLLQMTRAGRDITELTYHKDMVWDDESVVITFADGSKIDVNVTYDSGAALVTDVIKKLI